MRREKRKEKKRRSEKEKARAGGEDLSPDRKRSQSVGSFLLNSGSSLMTVRQLAVLIRNVSITQAGNKQAKLHLQYSLN